MAYSKSASEKEPLWQNKTELAKPLSQVQMVFIGSHLVERLLEQGVEVTALCIYNSMGTCGWLEHFRTEINPTI